jgi:hypothetical protein
MKIKVEKKRLDLHFEALVSRYYQWLEYHYNKNLDIAIDKKSFINDCISKTRAQFIFYNSDLYLKEMINVFRQKRNLQWHIQDIIHEVHQVRILLRDQQRFGIEYNSGYVPVYNYVDYEKDSKILKLIVQYVVPIMFYKNVLEGKQSDAELTGQSKTSKSLSKISTVPIAFQWHSGIAAEQQMKVLHSWLIEQRFIEPGTKLKDFKNVFRSNNTGQYIVWIDDVGNLVYLIDGLTKYFFVIPESIKEIIKSDSFDTRQKKIISNWVNPRLQGSFRDKDLNIISKETFKDTRNNYQNKIKGRKPSKGTIIDKLIIELKKIK